ncbi:MULTISPECIES: competence protein CoiA family protein [Aerosakkonema]|uniref:competence protein CoiA family protein n=1 Tax=Aerosakkonema TaxID=1246629 RepID=UPI0035BB6C68
MEFARSIYLGGEVIYANDKRLNNNSYKEWGLYCPECGEEVHLRHGLIRESYFAHFKQITDTECNLRVSIDGNSKGKWTDLKLGRGQRRELFQEHFLNIIARNDSVFFIKIQQVKDIINTGSLVAVTQEVRRYFIKNTNTIIEASIQWYRSKHNETKFKALQEKIIGEAIEYLCVESSLNVLQEIIYYCVYSSEWIFEDDAVNKLIHKLSKLIGNTDWTKEIFILLQDNLLQPEVKKTLIAEKAYLSPDWEELQEMIANYSTGRNIVIYYVGKRANIIYSVGKKVDKTLNTITITSSYTIDTVATNLDWIKVTVRLINSKKFGVHKAGIEPLATFVLSKKMEVNVKFEDNCNLSLGLLGDLTLNGTTKVKVAKYGDLVLDYMKHLDTLFDNPLALLFSYIFGKCKQAQSVNTLHDNGYAEYKADKFVPISKEDILISMIQTYQMLAELNHPSARHTYGSAMAAYNKLAALQASTDYQLPSILAIDNSKKTLEKIIDNCKIKPEKLEIINKELNSSTKLILDLPKKIQQLGFRPTEKLINKLKQEQQKQQMATSLLNKRIRLYKRIIICSIKLLDGLTDYLAAYNHVQSAELPTRAQLGKVDYKLLTYNIFIFSIWKDKQALANQLLQDWWQVFQRHYIKTQLHYTTAVSNSVSYTGSNE